MNRKTSLAATLLFVLVAANVLCAAHPYHVSLTEIERNPKTGNLEISMCLWPNDVEQALKQMEQRPINLDTEQDLDDLLHRYLAKRFEIQLDGKKASKFRWVGHETDNQQTWVYFEVPAKSAASFQLKNRVFFELNEDQQNEIRIRSPKFRHSISSHPHSDPITFSF